MLVVVNVVCRSRSAPQVRPVMEVGRNAISGLNHCPLIVQAAERKHPDWVPSTVQPAEESVTKRCRKPVGTTGQTGDGFKRVGTLAAG